jgi:hypothetical protein
MYLIRININIYKKKVLHTAEGPVLDKIRSAMAAADLL